MKYSPINKVLAEKLSGEWGAKPKDDYGVKVIRTANFTNLGTIDFSNIAHRKVEPKKVERKKLVSGDVIIEKSGGSPTQPVGRVVYFENPDNSIYLCNNFTTVLRPDRSVVFPKYLFYVLFYNHLIKKTLRFQNKTVGIINLKLENYLNSEIPLPRLEDQIRIATVLTRAERIIAKRKESIKALDELLKSTFLEMFGNPVRNEKMWEKKILKSFGQIITGNTPPRNNFDNYSSDFIEWIKTDNIVTDQMYITVANEFLSEIGFQKARFVNRGALLVACIAGSVESIGRAAITDRRVSFNQQINAIQPNEDVNALFLYWLFKLSKLYIQSHATKGMKKILTKGNFEHILMIKPPLHLQNQFAAIVEKVESIKAKQTQSLAELQNLYASLSQRAFTGELDLSRVPVAKQPKDKVIIAAEGPSYSTSLRAASTRNVIAPIDSKAREMKFSKEHFKTILAQIKGETLTLNELQDIIAHNAFEPLENGSYFEELPEIQELQNLIIENMESNTPDIEQVFDILNSEQKKDIKEKQIALRMKE